MSGLFTIDSLTPTSMADFKKHLYNCFKIKNPPPAELCWQKKEIPRLSFIFLGWPQPSAANI
jgi:hypothetical protein